MAAKSNAPIIIKRKKIIAGGHHGGAWKVAYADFVTAMMAFFLLMWLLNATTEQQLKGLADYFSPTIPLSRVSGGSDGMFSGNTLDASESAPETGDTSSSGIAGENSHPSHDSKDGTAAAEAAEVAALRDIEEVLLGRGGESLVSEQALRHVVTRLTDEGLVIEIFALPGVPLFEGDTAVPMPVTQELIALIARLSAPVINAVAVGGHTPARPIVLALNPVWDISTSRADGVRRLLERGGVDSARMRRVTGHADRSPAVSNPAAIRNDRVEIILLRTTY